MKHTTCPRCNAKNCYPGFCRLCADHFGPGTPWPTKPGAAPPIIHLVIVAGVMIVGFAAIVVGFSL